MIIPTRDIKEKEKRQTVKQSQTQQSGEIKKQYKLNTKFIKKIIRSIRTRQLIYLHLNKRQHKSFLEKQIINMINVINIIVFQYSENIVSKAHVTTSKTSRRQ